MMTTDDKREGSLAQRALLVRAIADPHRLPFRTTHHFNDRRHHPIPRHHTRHQGQAKDRGSRASNLDHMSFLLAARNASSFVLKMDDRMISIQILQEV